MSLETGTYLNDLNTSNPAASDNVGEGDDHLRLIKNLLKATFPGMGGINNGVTTKTTSFAVAATDNTHVWHCNASITISLPAAATAGNGFTNIVRPGSTGVSVTVNPSGSETVNGSLTQAVPYGQIGLLSCNGSSWTMHLLRDEAIAANLGPTSISGTLYVSGGAFFGSTVSISGSVVVGGTLFANGALQVSAGTVLLGSLHVDGVATLSGIVACNGALFANGGLDVSGVLNCNSTAFFSSTVTISGTCVVGGSLWAAGYNVPTRNDFNGSTLTAGYKYNSGILTQWGFGAGQIASATPQVITFPVTFAALYALVVSTDCGPTIQSVHAMYQTFAKSTSGFQTELIGMDASSGTAAPYWTAIGV